MAGLLAGKRALVTGATTGVGRATAVALGRLGAEVLLVARDRAKGESARAEVAAAGAPAAHVLLADLSLMAAVRALADEVRGRVDRLDVLVNNAGAIFATREVTAEGFERTFALNHLSYFLLTNLLLERLRAAAQARIVNVASRAHTRGHVDFGDLQFERGYTAFGAYSTTKLENLMFTFALARRLAGSGVTANAVHPGVVASNFGRSNRGWFGGMFALGAPFMRTPEKGARTSVWLASAPELAGVSGKYFADCKEKTPTRAARDEAAQERLWDATAGLLAAWLGG